MSAASPGIGQALASRYGISPVVILNAFDSTNVKSVDTSLMPADSTLRFFWFSQTAGPDRGLDQFMAMAPKIIEILNRPLMLTVVGRPVAGFDTVLTDQAKAAGLSLELQPLMPPSELIPLAASHHCGLALEHITPVNKDICLANKIFTYLAAGIPMLLSATTAHRNLAPELGDSALLLSSPAQPAEVAQWLKSAVISGQGASTAKAKCDERFSWQRESAKFLEQVYKAI